MIFYDKATGRVVAAQYENLDAEGRAFHQRMFPEQGILSGFVDDLHLYYVEGGVLKQKPPAPSENHQWSDTDKAWVIDVAEVWARVRSERDSKLKQSDWTVLPDSPLQPHQRGAWVEYRQALRDVTRQPNPVAIIWPTPPTA